MSFTAIGFHNQHGANVRLSDLTTADHSYQQAQGLFIFDKPLEQPASFRLFFQGTGVVKIHSLWTKEEARRWVRNRICLPKGCMRLRNGHGLFVVDVRFDPRNNCFRFLNRGKNLQREARGGKLLIFDIEYGDVSITACSEPPGIRFDPDCHCPDIKISNRNNFTTANLTHFNPLGLCRLLSPVASGETYSLTVTGKKARSGRGPYLRVLAAPPSCEHLADVGPFMNLASREQVRTAVIYIESRKTVNLVLRLRSGNSETDLPRKSGESATVLEMRLPSPGIAILWCELHKASLKIWRHDEQERWPRESTDIKVVYDSTTGPNHTYRRSLSAPASKAAENALARGLPDCMKNKYSIVNADLNNLNLPQPCRKLKLNIEPGVSSLPNISKPDHNKETKILNIHSCSPYVPTFGQLDSKPKPKPGSGPPCIMNNSCSRSAAGTIGETRVKLVLDEQSQSVTPPLIGQSSDLSQTFPKPHDTPNGEIKPMTFFAQEETPREHTLPACPDVRQETSRTYPTDNIRTGDGIRCIACSVGHTHASIRCTRSGLPSFNFETPGTLSSEGESSGTYFLSNSDVTLISDSVTEIKELKL